MLVQLCSFECYAGVYQFVFCVFLSVFGEVGLPVPLYEEVHQLPCLAQNALERFLHRRRDELARAAHLPQAKQNVQAQLVQSAHVNRRDPQQIFQKVVELQGVSTIPYV